MKKNDTLKKEIGKRVEKIRTEHLKTTKENFSALVDMQKSYLVQVENGEKGLTVERVVKICDETNTSADYLLRGIEHSLIDFAKENLKNYTDKEIEASFELLKTLILLIKHK